VEKVESVIELPERTDEKRMTGKQKRGSITVLWFCLAITLMGTLYPPVAVKLFKNGFLPLWGLWLFSRS